MKNIIYILSIIMLSIACESKSTSSAEHEPHGDHGPTGVTVTLSQDQMDAIDLTMTHIENKNMSLDIIVNGSIEIPPQFMADISPIMGGIVKNIYVIEGDKVKKGQVLATLQHPDFIEIQNNYSNNISQLEYIEKEYSRQEKLNSEKVVSDKSFQKITAEYKSLKSTINAQKVKLQMLGLSTKGIENGKIYSSINVVSPFNGFVSAVETNIGSFVNPQSRLFEVVNNNELHADFMVYEKDISKIEVGQKIYFTTSSLGQEFEAEIHNISPIFEENPKALHIHADILSEKGKLIPGMYINGRLLAENVETKAVLSQAVISDKGKNYIFAKTSPQKKSHGHDHATSDHHDKADHKKAGHEKTDHHQQGSHDNSTHKGTHNGTQHKGGHHSSLTFKRIEVIIGNSSGGYTEIKPLTSISDSTKIVANGAYFVLSELTKEENEHSH